MPEEDQQPTPLSQDENKSSNKKSKLKFILVLEIIIIFLGLAFVGYLYVTKDKEETSANNASQIEKIDTSNWEIYRSTVDGFQISYPKNVTLEESAIEGEAGLTAFIPLGETTNNVSFRLSGLEGVAINSAVGIDTVNYAFDAKQTAEIMKSSSATPMTITKTNIGGRTAYKTEVTPPGFEGVYSIFLSGNKADSAYSIIVSVESPDNIKIVDNMLATFKFID